MFIRPWLEALKSRCMPGNRLVKRRADRQPVPAQVESLEDKSLLAAFDLITVIPNQGVFLSDGAKMNEAPKEMTLRFSPGQSIDPTTIGGAISITRAGVDGIFNTSDTPSTDDMSVPIGYIGAGDQPNEVIVRFAQTLADDQYQIHIAGAGAAALKSVTDTFNNGQENAKNTFRFELDLGAQVQAVVPQPVIRSAVFSTVRYGALVDGDVVTITSGANTYNFEINLLPNGVTKPGNIAVNVSNGASANQIADALVAAINANTGGNLSAADGGTNTITVTGSAFEPTVTFATTQSDAFAKTFLTLSSGAAITDGDLVKVTLNNTLFTFEFNKAPNNSVGIGNIRVDIAAGDSAATVAAALRDKINGLAINSPTSQLKATVVGSSIALTALPALGTPSIAVTTANAGILTQAVGTLSQATSKVVVYFNQDELSAASANDPKFYQLIDTATNSVLLPASVNYTWNAVTGLSVAVLTFPSPLANSSYNLKIGASTEPNNTTATAVESGIVFNGKNFVVNSYLGDGTGSSSDSSDVDLYRVSTTALGDVTLTLAPSATLNGVITLLDSNGQPIGSPIDANGAGGQETLFAAGLPAGVYYAKVSSSSGTGGFKLTVQASTGLTGNDDNSSFNSATQLGSLGASGVLLTGAISPQPFSYPYTPGGSDEPGERQLPPGAFTGPASVEVNHGTPTGTGPAGSSTAVQTYSFPATYNASAAGLGILNNQITDQQKEIVRKIFAIFSAEAGIQFREVVSGGSEQIVVGDIRALAPQLPPDAVGGIAGGSLLIMNGIFYSGNSVFGDAFTGNLFHEIGHNLGLGHSYDVPSIQGAGPSEGNLEPVFTGDNDILHLLRDFPAVGTDIDLYQFNVSQPGTLSAQTIAERLGTTNLLNTVLTLYKQDASGAKTVVARNDDFYSKDSGIEIAVDPGTYFIGVTSQGNENYDPSASNTGYGGRSQGTYQLKLDFQPADASISGMQDKTGQFLDGDNDGVAGGQYNAWFQVAPTVIVDKLAPAGGNGTLNAPYNTISAGLAAAPQGSIVRIVGNGGADGNDSTTGDNVPYLIGQDYDQAKTTLADGATFQVPKGVTVMIEAGAVVKLHAQTIDVGSSSAGIDRSHGALQVLGTPANTVTFTSWRDDASGSIDDASNGAPTGNDWGGIVFRKDSDSTTSGVYLNTVNYATLQYGGGKVSVDGNTPVIYNALDIESSRPTLTNNIIRNNADAAISANPDSFKADDGRLGPDIHGNIITGNSTNGLFIRVQTPLGGEFEQLNVQAAFTSTDITYVITQNLILNGHPAGSLAGDQSARLMIAPGVVVKLSGARIETGAGSSNLIAEGTEANPIHFTSQQDDRYGNGGTFDLKGDGFGAAAQPQAGNWSGIFAGQTSTASLDHVTVTYAGGISEIAGNSDNFNALEVLQGNLRVSNSLFANNAGGGTGGNRDGRGNNDNSTIFVRGAQPILVNNTFRDNVGSVISINANSMQSSTKPDYGRSTGSVDDFEQFDDNYGPLVRLNKFANSTTFVGASTLGMTVRAEELTIESIWDDTDIAHVVTGNIVSNEFHHVGGLTLQSSATGSLIVKLQGATAGFKATGDPLEIDDRLGGSVAVIGQPNFPVILTSLRDDSVSAGFKPNGFPQFDTNGDNNAGGASAGLPGDWNSLLFTQYSNDTNMALVNETEPGMTHGVDVNALIGNSQALGNLAPNLNSGDENRRLGYEVHGFISPDASGDVDVYSFTAVPGTQVWFDTDFTSQRLDVMLELLDSAGNVLARSLNSQDESANPAGWLATYAGSLAGSGGVNTLTANAALGGDFYTSNFHDAGFRATLPGTSTLPVTYFVRVRSQPVAGQETAAVPVGGNGLTSGAYQLQLRLQQVDQVPGSTVRYADIRFATNGIETRGLPAHSPLMGESGETTAGNDTIDPANTQNLGPLLQTDRNTLSVSGNLNTGADVDFYKFTVNYSQIQVISGGSDGDKFFPTMFDIDYADGLTRPDTSIAVFNGSGALIYIGRASDIANDQPRPGFGQDLTDLTRGSLGTKDAFIGTVNLPAGIDKTPPPPGLMTYYVAVFSNGMMPTALTAVFNGAASGANQLVRLEPVDSIRRIAEDHIGTTGYSSQKSAIAPINGPLISTSTAVSLQANIRPFTLTDVNLFVTSPTQLRIVDPFNGRTEVTYPSNGGLSYQDLDMRSDGRLFGVRVSPNDSRVGSFVEMNTGTGGELSAVNDGISDPGVDSYQQNYTSPDALAIHRADVGNYDYIVYAARNSDEYTTNKPTDAAIPTNIPEDPDGNGVSKLYRANAAGNAGFVAENTGAVGNIRDNAGVLASATMGMQYFNGILYGVSAAGQFYRINDIVSPKQANPDDNLLDAAITKPTNLVTSTVFNLTARTGGAGFAGLTDAPQNVENSAYAGFLFALTTDGKMLAIDPNNPTATHLIFDSNSDNVADSDTVAIAGGAGATGLAFSPVDFNLWHPTMARANDAGHGINTTTGTPVDPATPATAAVPGVDNSRAPDKEDVKGVVLGSEAMRDTTQAAGNASMYFGIENYSTGNDSNYFQYQSGGQYGVISSRSHEDLTAGTSSIHNNYNAPGGASGSLVTNAFSLQGYSATDKPTVYFNYFLDTQNANGKLANSMQDSARVYISTNNGLSWSLLATNNSTLSAEKTTDAELPSYLSTDRTDSPYSNQGVQELFDTASWRQARIDLNDYVGASQVKLRFDFSTSGNTGTVVDPATGLRVPSDNRGNPTFQPDTGSTNGVGSLTDQNNSSKGAQDNAHEGFYIDDIIVGFAGRGEMVTNSASQGSTFTDLYSVTAAPFAQKTKNPDLTAPKPLLEGNYQLEIRRGQDYGTLAIPTKADVLISPTASINDTQFGDSNLVRTQGQFIIEGNQIVNSSQNGIFINDNVRIGSVPHPGAPINLPVSNSSKLLTGMYVQNNTIARSGAAGISITGDSNQALGAAMVPFVKVVNNTIYGGDVENPTDTTVGVLIANNASPTLMNNAIVNTNTAVKVTNSSAGELEANLFQGNRFTDALGNNVLLNPSASSALLFVDAAKNNFYPADNSALIDSSRSTFNDRTEYIAVTDPLGIPKSPIVAPLYDQFGQLRVDDLSQAGPSNQPGLGQNPFQDRGSVERSDFDGGVVVPSSPLDNDGNGVDLDPTSTIIWIDSANLAGGFINQTAFKLQLIDTGIGIDDSSVDLDGSDFTLFKNGTPLVQGLDYIFTYNQNTNEAIFTSISTFELDARYGISVDASGIVDLAGNVLQNNHATADSLGSLLYFNYVLTNGKNDAPIASFNGIPLPAAPAVGVGVVIDEDTPITFSTTNNNAITVSDLDAFLAPDGDPNAGALGGRIRATVSVPAGFGTLALAAGARANLDANGGSITPIGSPVNGFILEGRIDDINTALNGISYTPRVDFPIGLPAATVNLSIVTEDLGKFGPTVLGNPVLQTTTNIVPILINPVNDTPTLTIATPGPITILEDAGSLTQINLSNITAGGGESQSLRVTATSSNQALIPNGNIVVGYPNQALPLVQPDAGNIRFTALPDQFGTSTLTITVTDAGLDGVFGTNPGTGINDDLNVSRTITVNVTPVNDAPTIALPGNVSTKEDSGQQSINLGLITVGPANESVAPENQTFTLAPVNIVNNGNTSPLVTFGTIFQNPDGTWSLPYTPALNANGTVTVQLRVTDSGINGGANGDVNNTTTLPFTITITPVNDAPTVTLPTDQTILEDDASNPQVLTLTGVSAGPFEPAQSITSITVTSSDQSIIPDANIVQGILTGGNLPLTITPLADQFGEVTITVTMVDDGPNSAVNGDVNTITKTFKITILPVNDEPSFDVVAPASILEDSPQQTLVLTGLSVGPLNESLPPLSQTLTLSAVSLNPDLIGNPIIVEGTDTIKYTPVHNAIGQAIIRVTLKDSGGTDNGGDDTYTQDIIINLVEVNDPPTLAPIANQPESGILLEDAGQQTVNLTGITAGPPDEIAQTMTVTASITAGNPNLVNNFIGSLVSANGTATLKYTPVANEFGTATVTVKITDSGANGISGAVNFTTQTFTITIVPVNDAPLFNVLPPQTIIEDDSEQMLILPGLSAGPANESAPPLSQTIVVSAISLTPDLIPNPIVVGSNFIRYKPVADADGQAIIRVTVKDNGGTANGGSDTYTQDIVVNITAVNDAPTISPIPAQPLRGIVLEDAAPQPVILSGITAGPLNESTQALTIVAAVTGGNMNLLDNITVGPISPTGTATLTFTPAPDEFGVATVTVTVTDDQNASISRSFTITITPVDDAPHFDVVGPQTIVEDAPQQTLTLTGVVAGPANESGQGLILSAVSLNPDLIANPIIVSGTDTLKYTPLANANGQAIIRVTLRDDADTAGGGVNTYTQDIVINITPVNDAPTLAPIANQPVTGLVLEDAGQQTINITGITAGPANESAQSLTMTATITGGNLNLVNNFVFSPISGNGLATLKYTPVANQFGTAVVTVTVRDNGASGGANGDVNTVTGTFTITIIPVNDTPTIAPISDQITNEDAGLQSVALSGISTGVANETPPQTLGFTVSSDNPALIPNDADHLSVDYTQGQATGILNYKALPNAFGVATITLTLKDSGGTENGGNDAVTRTFKITVNAQPDAPTEILLSNAQIFENEPTGTFVGTLASLDTDLPSDTFTYSIVGGTGLGLFQISGNQLQTAQVLDFEAVPSHSYTLTIRSTDKFGLSFDKTVTVAVQNVDDAPTLDAILPVTMNEDPASPLVVNLTGITAGPGENQPLTVTVTSDNPDLFANPIPVTYSSPGSTGTLSLMPKLNASGTATITVTVKDSNGGSAFAGIDTITRTFTVTVNPSNDSPTDILLSNDTVAETPPGTPLPTNILVGQLTSTDIDNPAAGNTFTYSLVAGAGSNDNTKFAIVNGQLFAVGELDFEAQRNYSVRIRTTDSGSPQLSFEKVFTIHSTDVNEPITGLRIGPNDVTGIPNSVPENRPIGSVVGTLIATDPDAGESATFTLISGATPNDNALFKIVNGQLVTNALFDFETKTTYTVLVRALDSHGLPFEMPLTVNITNVDEPPLGINLSNNLVPEDLAVDQVIGTLTTQDTDVSDTATYSLVVGTGSGDNARFKIVDDKLVLAAPLNFEERPNHSYSVRIRSNDSDGLSLEKVFTISVTDVNEAPTDLTLTPTTINENLPISSLIGLLTPADPDSGDTFTYQFVDGPGSADNAAFQLNGNKLQAAVVFDFETKPSYSVRIRVTDGGGHQVERQFTIRINDTTDPATIVLNDTPLTRSGNKAVVVDPGAAIFDNDSPNFDGSRLVVSIQAGEQNGDTLSLLKEKGSNPLKLKLAKGKTVLLLGKTEIATVRGGTHGVALEIRFGDGIDQSLIQRVMRQVTFRGKPSSNPHQIGMQVFDKTGLASQMKIRTIN